MKLVSIIIGLLLLPVMAYYEKSIEIKGSVLDAIERAPLKDSHIYVKGTNIGVVSDDNGEFAIQVPLIYIYKPIIVSYVGYANYEEKIHKIQGDEIQIVMQPAVVVLNEITVMPGKALLVDQAIDRVLAEYNDQEAMLTDFYSTLFLIDKDLLVLKKVMQNGQVEE